MKSFRQIRQLSLRDRLSIPNLSSCIDLPNPLPAPGDFLILCLRTYDPTLPHHILHLPPPLLPVYVQQAQMRHPGRPCPLPRSLHIAPFTTTARTTAARSPRPPGRGPPHIRRTSFRITCRPTATDRKRTTGAAIFEATSSPVSTLAAACRASFSHAGRKGYVF